jgi:pimeloyl-ACP methyl ester carboxylesterase
MIAQNFYLKYPKMVDKLILIATNYGRKDTEWVEVAKNSRLEQIEFLNSDPHKAFKLQSRWVYHVKFRKEMEQNPKKKFHGLFSMEDLINNSTINPSNPQDVINQANAMKDHYTYEKLHTISAETLLLAASHDRQTPLSVMQEMQEIIPNSTLEIIQNAGHFMTFSKAPEVNKIILDFLEK